MIDICDFAVGLVAPAYGLTIATERPDHRMMETWHPLGVVGVISAFNFPGGGVGVECVPGPWCAATAWCGSRREDAAHGPCGGGPVRAGG
jgi:hypothetical protein